MADWKKICCAVDFSDPSRAAMEEACALARRTGAELTLLHVWDPHAPSPEVLLAKLEQAGPELEARLASWARDAGARMGGSARTVLLTGPAAGEIVRFARDGGVDLVVMATHGRSGLARVLLGSVAEHVVREASCSVLVVRRPAAAGTTG
jgi:nucleotide-binding universal stress UspA family protein